jgi:hypothetical protein
MLGRKVDIVLGLAENSSVRASALAMTEPPAPADASRAEQGTGRAVEAEGPAFRPSHPRGPRMPANWISERPSPRRMPRSEAPRLELPVHQPAFERAQPGVSSPVEPAQPVERGAVVVDFYI